MKRLKYISRQSHPMKLLEVDELVRSSSTNNAKVGITGALTVTGHVFFQILEGPDDVVDALFAKIKTDPRHTDVVCLAEQAQREDRLFPHWGMHRVSLENSLEAQTVEALLHELAGCDEAARPGIYDQLSRQISAALMAA